MPTDEPDEDASQSWAWLYESPPDPQNRSDDSRSGPVSQSGPFASNPGNINGIVDRGSPRVVDEAAGHGRASYESATGTRLSGERPRGAPGASSKVPSSQPSRAWGPRTAPSRLAGASAEASASLQVAARGRDAGNLDPLQNAARVSPREQFSAVCDPY
jgi:hypothetical protein